VKNILPTLIHLVAGPQIKKKKKTEAEDIKKRWQEYTEELHKKHLHDPYNSPRPRHPGMQSQVGLRKHHYEQS